MAMLNTVVHGDPGSGATPLLIAHGLYGSARNWGVIARRLSADRPVLAVDMRNHGDSFHDPDHSYPAMARDLAKVIDAHGSRAHVLGHSMGGKAAMVLAADRPELVDRLIVADIAPVAYGHTQLPYIAAMEAVDLSGITRRAEADKQIAAHVEDVPLRAFLLQSLELGDGPPRWKLNLQALRDQMPLIMGFPELAPDRDRAVTVLRGGLSDYVAGTHEAAMMRHFPRARLVTIDGAGHWLHAEAPRDFEAALRDALG